MLVFSISMSRKDYVIQLTLRIRACARVISLASVLWPRHTSPKCAVAKACSVLEYGWRAHTSQTVPDFSMQMSSGTGPRP